ncbi:hypothetical protein HALLA_18525 [Halostagnicola larsenii XH-48]|uniref:Uncharacterized protein n=1 Tax=Halostagnicola larsenii XH-48 TaxID=797299 RepID=W0JUY2_9EURY|nr:hypothetical protein HALLA_18525 [Halostagnicola larsenii XH-48]
MDIPSEFAMSANAKRSLDDERVELSRTTSTSDRMFKSARPAFSEYYTRSKA